MKYSINDIHHRKEREANARLGKERQSKLLVPVEGSVNDNDEDGAIHQTASELSHPIRELCQTANGFVYVVDSSANTQRGKEKVFIAISI